jgi:simple sugar transport system ATP-binding protein
MNDLPPSDRTGPEPFLSLYSISKRFDSLWANRDISLNFQEGEIHAIVGENGAGKSTLMKILNGHLQPDSGEIRLNGRRMAFRGPQDAMVAGIGMAYQQFLIFPQLTALENVVVGFEPGTAGWISRRQARDELVPLCRSVGFDLPLNAMASELSFAHRQQIEILRLLYRKVKMLILDEPTSLLAPPETKSFLDLLQSLQTAGHTILFISHRLQEVFAIADRVSVLSRGKLIGSYPKSEISMEDLIQLIMSGGEPCCPTGRVPGNLTTLERNDRQLKEPAGLDAERCPGEAQRIDLPDQGLPPDARQSVPDGSAAALLLEVREATARPAIHEAGLSGFSFNLFEGEIFGVGGVVGNGQRTLALLLSGMLPAEHGSVVFSGEDITHLPLKKRADMGIRWLPSNPLEEALLPTRSIRENVLLGFQRHQTFQLHGWLMREAIECWAKDQLQQNEVVHAALTDSVQSLSGGNLQKLALARVLEGIPRLVVLEQPASGLDIRAQERMRDRVRKLNAGGTAFLLISYDLDELLALSHRIGILYRGRMMGIAMRNDVSLEQLGRWMLGVEG